MERSGNNNSYVPSGEGGIKTKWVEIVIKTFVLLLVVMMVVMLRWGEEMRRCIRI